MSKSGVRVELAEPIDDLVKPGDGVVFDLGKPEENEPGGRVWRVNRLAATRSGACESVELRFEPGALDPSQIPVGCDVWKTDDPALRKRLEHTYAQDKTARRVVLTATLTGAVGGPLTLTLSDDEGHAALATWPGPLELARKRATEFEEIEEQLGRLGDTPFELGELRVELPAGVLVPRSVLNDLRRQAAGELAERRVESRKHAVFPEAACGFARERKAASGSRLPALTVLVRNLEQLDAVLAWVPPAGLPRPAAVYCDFEDLRRYKDAVPKARIAGVPVGLAPLRILKPGEDGTQALVARAEPDIVLVRNLASLSFFREQLPAARLVGDFSLNVANELTAELLIDSGLERLVPSYDLNWEEFASMVRRANPALFEPVVHQHMPMFHMEHCVFAAFLSTGKDHRDCGRPCETHKVELRDRVGAAFPVLPDTGCRNTVFNSVAQSGAEYVGRMRELGITRFRVDLLREAPAQVAQLLDCYARVIAGQDDGRATWRELRVLNQLGVTRGTLQLA